MIPSPGTGARMSHQASAATDIVLRHWCSGKRGSESDGARDGIEAVVRETWAGVSTLPSVRHLTRIGLRFLPGILDVGFWMGKHTKVL